MPSTGTRFLKEAVDSIRAQTLKEFEVLFFDNTMEGRGLYFGDDRFRVIETNGKSVAWCHNESKILARSPYLIVAHDDDISFPERAEVTLSALKNAHLVWSSSIYIDEQGQYKALYITKPFDPDEHRAKGCQVNFAFCGYRLTSAPIMINGMNIICDYAFVWSCYLQGLRMQHITAPLGLYRAWGSTSKTKLEQKHIESERIRKWFGDPDLRREHRDEIKAASALP